MKFYCFIFINKGYDYLESLFKKFVECIEREDYENKNFFFIFRL